MPNSTIHNILYKTAVPSFGSLMKICDGFGITMAQFFAENDAVYLTDDQKELLELYGNLSLHEREIAAAYLKGFASRK